LAVPCSRRGVCNPAFSPSWSKISAMLKTTLAALLFLAGMIQQVPKQLVDNERGTVWDSTWIKGKPTSHQNKFDQVTVELADASVRITTPDGKSRSTTLKF